MATKASVLPDTKAKAETKIYLTIKNSVLAYVETSRTKVVDMVKAAYNAKSKLMDEVRIRGDFKKAFGEVTGNIKGDEYRHHSALISKVIKVVFAMEEPEFTNKLRHHGFHSIYESLPSKHVGRPNGNKSQKDELTDEAKNDVANAGAYLESLNKSDSKKPSTNSQEKDEDKKGYIARQVAGKAASHDPLLKEIESYLTDDGDIGRLSDIWMKLTASHALTEKHMYKFIESYFNSEKDRAIELTNYLLTEDEWMLEAAEKFFTEKHGKEFKETTEEMRRANMKAAKAIVAMDETEEEMKRIRSTNKRKLVGKKRG